MRSSTGLDISQHKGYGKKLLQKAEEIAFNNGYKKLQLLLVLVLETITENKVMYMTHQMDAFN